MHYFVDVCLLELKRFGQKHLLTFNIAFFYTVKSLNIEKQNKINTKKKCETRGTTQTKTHSPNRYFQQCFNES